MASPSEIAAKQLAWELETRKSVELNVTTTITNHDGAQAKPQAFNTIEEHYIETAAGQRYCRFQGLLSGKVTTRFEHFGNGSKFADVNFDPKNPDQQQMVLIKRQYFMEDRSDRKEVPQPLLYLYVGQTPLHEALPKAQHIGTDKVLGRECDLFLFPKVRWPVTQDQVFYLDRATSLPLKVESFRDQEARNRKEPMGDWTALTLDRVQGHYVPLKSRLSEKRKDGSTSFSWDYQVNSIQFDKEYPASTFWPIIQPGAVVLDGITGKTSNMPGNVKADAKTQGVEPKIQEQQATSSVPNQAVPPRDWTSSASTVSLGLGCAILLVGGLVWWGRR